MQADMPAPVRYGHTHRPVLVFRCSADRPVPVKVKPPKYQPSVSELNEEYGMPGADMKDLRRAFFKTVEEEAKTD